MAILGVVGIVLLVGAALVLYGGPQGKVVVSNQPAQPEQVETGAPAEGEKCLNPGSCRTLQLCSTVSDGLYTDGVGMGCVNAEDNADIPYCRRLTKAQGSEPCNYMDKNPRCVCL